jgi:hypothetical protein
MYNANQKSVHVAVHVLSVEKQSCTFILLFSSALHAKRPALGKDIKHVPTIYCFIPITVNVCAARQLT